MKKVNTKRVLYAICFVCIMLIDWSRGAGKWHHWAALINLSGAVMSVIMMSHFLWKKQPFRKYAIWWLVWLIGSIAGFFVWKFYYFQTIFLQQYATAAISVGMLGMVALRMWMERTNLKDPLVQRNVLEQGNVLEQDAIKLGTLKRYPVAAIWIVMTIFMAVSKFGEIWQLYYLFIFGLFYCIPFSEEERKNLWDGLADGCILGFFMIQIWAYGFRPYDVTRYAGAYANCNMNALFYLVTYVMVLYRLHSIRWQKRNGEVADNRLCKVCEIFFTILAAGLLSFVIFTLTRTALLVAAGITVVYGVIEFLILEKKPIRLIVSGLMLAICTLLVFPCVYLTIRYLPTILHYPVWFEGEYSEQRVHSYDPYDSEKYVSLEEFLQEALGRFGQTVGTVEEMTQPGDLTTEETANPENVSLSEELTETEGVSLPEELPESEGASLPEELTEAEDVSLSEELTESESVPEAEGVTLSEELTEAEDASPSEEISPTEDKWQGICARAVALMTEEEKQLLSGAEAESSMRIRLEIYRKYLNHLNLMGHELEEGYFPITEDYHAWHAQNLFIQVLFYYGIPAGICLIVLMLILGIWAIKSILQKKRREDILVLLVWMLFVGYGMMECVWYLGQSVLFLIYLVPGLLVDAKARKLP